MYDYESSIFSITLISPPGFYNFRFISIALYVEACAYFWDFIRSRNAKRGRRILYTIRSIVSSLPLSLSERINRGAIKNNLLCAINEARICHKARDTYVTRRGRAQRNKRQKENVPRNRRINEYTLSTVGRYNRDSQN